MKNCPQCGAEILMPVPVCVQCGADLTKTSNDGNNPKWTSIDISKAKETKIICPNCNSPLESLLISNCPNCGFNLAKKEIKVTEEKIPKVDITPPKPKIPQPKIEERKEKMPVTTYLIPVLVIVVIIIIIVLFFVMRPK